jgi:hypothetical protein
MENPLVRAGFLFKRAYEACALNAYFTGNISHFVPMKETSNSIFDEQFLASVSPRRLNIMPLLLKLYVGLYTVSGAVAGFRTFSSLILLVDNEGAVDGIDIIFIFGRYIISALRGGAALSLWLEKKWAVQAALIVSVLSVVTSLLVYGSQIFAEGMGNGLPAGLFPMALEIPYVFLLMTIRRDWRDKALSGREIKARKAEAAKS